ncbi:MAG: hypothetical protein ACI35P_16020 [Bacillus sp. (in: firmicutes)]
MVIVVGLFDLWAKKNKRDHVDVMSSQMVQIQHAQPQEKMSINIGSGGLLNATGTNDAEYLESVRAKITDDDLVRLEAIFKVTSGRERIFNRLEAEGIPLMYLVALGITSKEDIQSYLTVKERGLDLHGRLEETADVGVDTLYAREVLSAEQEYPRLRNVRGELIPDISEGQVVFNGREEMVQSFTHEEDEADGSDVNVDIMERLPADEEHGGHVPAITVGVDAPAEDSVDAEAVNGIEDKSVDAETDSKADGSWKDTLNQIMNEITNGQEEVAEVPVHTRPQKKRDREVYVLADRITLPDIEGYKFIQVTSIHGVNNFSAHRDNLLVITRQIPEQVLKHFRNWLRGIKSDGQKYRIVTLESSSVKDEVIEDEITLTKESLDTYYDSHDVDNYIGDGVGSFMDISTILKADE